MSCVSGMAHKNVLHPRKEFALQLSLEEINIGSYIACAYESDWYVETIKGISTEHNDVPVKFMDQKGFAKKLFLANERLCMLGPIGACDKKSIMPKH